jgi:hypothetical protein
VTVCFSLSFWTVLLPTTFVRAVGVAAHLRRRSVSQPALTRNPPLCAPAGFNGGSGLSAGSRGTFALVNSSLSASFAMFSWMAVDWYLTGKPQLVGACIGAVGGLATVTPAAGFVRPWAAALIGITCAPFCRGCVGLRGLLGWDDALDVWAVHGMGGIFGSILVGALADSEIGAVGASALLAGKQAIPPPPPQPPPSRSREARRYVRRAGAAWTFVCESANADQATD